MRIDPYKFQPLRDGVIVRDFGQKTHPLGLVLIRENPEMVDVVSNQTDGSHGDYRRIPIDGEVIAVGPGKYDAKGRRKPTVVKPGDKVRYSTWNDAPDVLPEGFRMIQEADIWGWLDAQA